MPRRPRPPFARARGADGLPPAGFFLPTKDESCTPPDSDPTGYNFWLGKFNEFGGDYEKAEMVKAFLSSMEYRGCFGNWKRIWK